MQELNTVISHTLLFISLYFEVFLLVTYLEKSSKKVAHVGTTESELPTATIIVPCFNEARTIAGTLSSLLKLDYPKDKYTIIVVNDGSTDGTEKILKRFSKQKNMTVYNKENGGKFTALNFALDHVTSDIVGCLDADSFVDKNALRRIAEKFKNDEVMAVTPSIIVHNPENPLQRMQRAEYSLGVAIKNVLSHLDSIYITPGPFSFFRRDVFIKFGKYRHAHNTEDLEIGLRLQTHRQKIVNVPNAYVYTVTPKSVTKLYKQRVRWIHGFLENMKEHRHLFFNRQYGHLSMFILPTAFLSVFSALYFTGTFVASAVSSIGDKIDYFSAVGFSGLSLPSFDWFFMNTQSFFFIGIAIFCATLTLISIGKYITEDRPIFSRDILYFFFLYSFIAPFWLGKSVYSAVFSKKNSWR